MQTQVFMLAFFQLFSLMDGAVSSALDTHNNDEATLEGFDKLMHEVRHNTVWLTPSWKLALTYGACCGRVSSA